MVALVSAWAALSGSAFAAVVVGGWLGPDTGRGSEFCEQAQDALIRQPVNTLSNLGFVLAGLAIAHQASRTPGSALPRRLATAYALLVVTLGPGSAAMHATQSTLGGRLDVTSMFLVSSFALAYVVGRLIARTDAFTVTRVFLAALLVQEVAYLRGGRLPWIQHSGNAAFALALALVVAIETALVRRARRTGEKVLDRRWLVAAVLVLLLALGIWSVSKTGGAWCDPTSLVQGHAVWHLLCAGAAYGLYRAYAGAARRR